MRLEKSIETPRFELHTLDSSFIGEGYLSWLNSEVVNQYLETRFSQQTVESLSSFVQQMLLSENSLLLAIVDKKTNKHIGNIKLGPINSAHNSAPLGLVIGESEWWGKGVAKEVISALTHWGFEELGLDKINAGSYASNIGSIRAFLACGYQEEGRQISQVNLVTGFRDDVVLLGKVRPFDAGNSNK
jgi:ribosomal-protein-alanine N-acetyltransferase